MINKIYLLTASCFTLAAFPLSAHGEEPAKDWTISGSAAFKSDYVFRGFSQTDEEPAVQGQLTATHKGGFAASLWGSNVDFNDSDEAASEVDATASYTLPVGPGNFTLGGIYYAYPGADSNLDYDYVEGFATYGLKVMDKTDMAASVYYSPDFFAGSGDAVYTNIGASIPLPLDGLSVNGSAGYQWIDDEDAFGAPDYADWTLGASYTYEKVNFGLNYYDTNISDNDCSSLCSERVVASVVLSF